MTLAEWIKAEGIKRSDAAKRLGIGKPYLTELCQRKKTPGTTLAIRIVEESGCRVTMRELVSEP